ncbi:MAG: O-methyltransferase [Kofleriaceae bacterium]|nr:O-methyltransferase [Myxococcales bacterium]MCB9562348.1 O-methyltransferase [Kofleriaceae bacterium]MCB9574765.1 O-methyltransferase [Kofleriaceae bacterium]
MADSDSRTGARYATPEILGWTDKVHAGHDDALARAFAVPDDMPSIMVGPSEGRLLSILCRMVGVRRAVEVGTLAGYSAIHLGRALPADGHLWTIEYEARHAEVARGNLAAAGLSDRVTVVEGAGVEILPTLEGHGPFDAVFIDADKASYAFYGGWAARHLRRGGLILGDNAYLFGELMEDTPRGRSMRQFHEQVARDFDSVCIPTPDGLVLGVKR